MKILECIVTASVLSPDLFPAWSADPYPAKPIRLLVGFAPGGANDLVARAVATRLGARLGQQVVVEDRAGAGGNIATEQGARAAPDGYTMLLASVASFAMSPALLGKVPYDPINDFAPVTLAAWVTAILSAHPSMPATWVNSSWRWRRSIRAGSRTPTPGIGSIAHLSSELFWHTAGIKLNHIPYKGGGPAVADAIAGHVGLHLRHRVDAGTPHRSGPVARTWRHQPEAIGGAAQRADHRRGRLSGLRGERLARLRLSGEDAAGHRRAHAPRNGGDPQAARGRDATGEPRSRHRDQRPREVPRPHQIGTCAVGEADQGSGD